MPVFSNPYSSVGGMLGRENHANLIKAAQLGVGPKIPMLDGAAPAVFPPAVVIITHVPTIFSVLPNGEATFKAIMERHAKSIEGIDLSYTIESKATPIGHDGQELQFPGASKRNAPSPTFTFDEVNGNLIWNFFYNWIRLIRNPDTQIPGISAVTNEIDITLPSSWGADALVIQFDGSYLPENIMDAYFLSSMWPEETGVLGVKRNVGQVESMERQIPFKAILQHNENTRRIGVEVANVLSLHRADYQKAPPVATEIGDRIKGMGIEDEIKEIVNDFK